MSAVHAREGAAPETASRGDDGPVFIGGLDRTGKTTMRAFLASHPRISIPAVGSNMETYFLDRFGDLADPANLDRCLDAMLRYKHVRFLQPDEPRIRREFAVGPATYERLFSLFLMHAAEREGKPRWGAQTGLIERYANAVLRAHPDARIVHMVRDPRDRYEASLALWPEGKGRAGGAAARWRYSMRLAERHLRRWPDRYLLVRFEDMIRDPEGTVRRVCGSLGEDFDPAMLAMPAADTLRAKLKAEDAEAGEGAAALSASFIGRYREGVPPREVAFLQAALGRRMRRYGYETPPVRLGAAQRAVFLIWEVPSQGARMFAWRLVEWGQQRLPRLVARRPGRRMIVDRTGTPAEGSA